MVTSQRATLRPSQGTQFAMQKLGKLGGKRPWWPTSVSKVKVFIGIFIYIGVVRLPAYKDY